MSEKLWYGCSAKSSTVHFAVGNSNDGFVARCDKRQKIDPSTTTCDATPDVITCKKCQRFADYKKYVEMLAKDKAAMKKASDETKEELNKAHSKPANETPKEKPAEDHKDELNNVPDNVVLDRVLAIEKILNDAVETFNVANEMNDTVLSVLKKMYERITAIEGVVCDLAKLSAAGIEGAAIGTKIKDESMKTGGVTEENYKDFLKDGEKNEDIGTVEGDQFRSVAAGNNTYRIVHIATNQNMFTNVPERIIKTALKYLNNLKIKWKNKNDEVPKDFVSACATAFKAACSSHGMVISVGTDPGAKPKPTRVIPRRKKEEKKVRKISRRKVAETDEYGFAVESLQSDLASMIKKGMHFGAIVDQCKDKYGLSDYRLRSKLDRTMKHLTKNGHPVMFINQADPNDDYYQIIENNAE